MRMNKTSRHLAVLAATFLLQGVAWSAVATAEGAKTALPMNPGTMAAPAAGTQKSAPAARTATDDVLRVGKRGAKYQFRCWQYGRLVFEESRDSLLADSAKVVTVSRGGEPGETVQVLDLMSSTCVLSVAPP